MKKFVVFIIGLVLMMSLCVPVFAAPSTYFVISNISASGAKAGETFDLSVELEAAQVPGSVSISVSGDVFTLDGNLTDVVVDMDETTKSFPLKVKVDNGVYKGRYPLTVTATYTPKEGESYPVTKSRTINIDVVGEEFTPPVTETASISISSIPSYSYVMPNSTVSIPIKFAASPAPGTATISVTGNNFVLASAKTFSVKDSDTHTWNVSVRCLDGVSRGNYPLNVEISYVTNSGATTSCTETVYLTVGETSVPEEVMPTATLEITSAPSGAIAAGETFTVGFSSYCSAVGAFGYGYAQGVVTVSGEGFTLAGSLAEQDISSGRNTITVLADKSLQTGRKQLVVTVTYKSGSETYTASRTLNIDIDAGVETVDESNDIASFKLTGASIPEKKGKSDLATTLKLTIENTTSYVAENVKVKLSNLGDLILNTYTDTVDAGDVAGGESVNVSFPIKFPEFPKAQSTVTAEITFDAPAGPQTQTMNVYLQATEKKEDEAPPESASLTPKVIVSQYSVECEGENVVSGEEFVLKFTLENTSTEKDLRNMTVNVAPQAFGSSSGGTTSGPVFSFIDGTSSFYTDIMEKSGTLEYEIRLKCSASAGAGSYPITISFNYEYADSGVYKGGNGEMDVNLPVSQPIKFELMEWTPPTESPLSGVPISFQYYNKSRNPMTSLTISCEGDFTMPAQTIGTLNASSYDYFSGTVTPVATANVGDTLTAVLVFTFEDAAGEEQRIEEPFECTVIEGDGDMGGMGDMFGDMGGIDVDMGGVYDPTIGGPAVPTDGENIDGESSGLPLWAKIAIPCAAALIVIIVIVIVVKKVKAKKASEDDDDE